MNATFETDAKTTYQVKARSDNVDKRVMFTVIGSDRVTAVGTPLTDSEARAIASALMGAAAELSSMRGHRRDRR